MFGNFGGNLLEILFLMGIDKMFERVLILREKGVSYDEFDLRIEFWLLERSRSEYDVNYLYFYFV